MNILKILINESKFAVVLCAVFSLIAGISKGMLIVIISEVISTHNFFSMKMIFYFVLILLISLSFRFINNVFIIRLVEGLTMKFRLHILNELRKSQFSEFEHIGQESIHNSLTRDCTTISHNVPEIIRMVSAFITVLVCMVYIITLSTAAFYLVVAAISAGTFLYLARQSTAKENLSEARTNENIVYKLILDFLQGFKELRMNYRKGYDLYYRHIEPSFNQTLKLRIKGLTSIEFNYALGLLLFFGFLGTVIFGLPHWGVESPVTIAKIAIILLYLIDPGGDFFYGALQMTNLRIAIDNIENLIKKEWHLEPEEQDSNCLNSNSLTCLKPTTLEYVREIHFEEVTYSYLDNNKPLFSIGPITLKIKKGETIFITGGNGSGKSTFCNVLTGLYTPLTGKVRVDDIVLRRDLYTAYRNLFSALFYDYYLFERLYGIHEIDWQNIQEYLAMIGLDGKAELHNGRFSTLNLSAGQRRRLALLVVLLEDHPVFVFDELTADQDAEFTQYFYEQIMLRLKAKGKTIVNITHNENYFHLADKLVRMEYGKILEVS